MVKFDWSKIFKPPFKHVVYTNVGDDSFLLSHIQQKQLTFAGWLEWKLKDRDDEFERWNDMLVDMVSHMQRDKDWVPIAIDKHRNEMVNLLQVTAKVKELKNNIEKELKPWQKD